MRGLEEVTDTIPWRDFGVAGIVTDDVVANTFCLLAVFPNMEKDDECTMHACVFDIEEVDPHDMEMDTASKVKGS